MSETDEKIAKTNNNSKKVTVCNKSLELNLKNDHFGADGRTDVRTYAFFQKVAIGAPIWDASLEVFY